MNTRKILIIAAVIGLLLLSGCVATPYYGGSGYYRTTAQGYGYQPYATYGYRSIPRYGMPNYSIGGRIHLHGGHRHGIGGHRHWGGHKHSGGHGRGHGRRH